MIAKPPSAAQSRDLSRLYLAVMEHAPLPMATVEGATHIVRFVNPAFCRLMDQPREKLLGKPISELLPEKDECVTLLDRVTRTGEPQSHTEEDQSKPHPVFWSYTMWPVQADELLVGIMIQVTETAQVHGTTVAMNQALMLSSLRQHELTEAAENLNVQLRAEMDERKRTEQELSEKARLLDLSNDAVIVHDLEGNISSWNKGAERLYGWAAEEVIGKHCHTLLQTELPQPMEQIVAQLQKEGRFSGEFVQIARDGRRVAALCRKVLDRGTRSILTSYTDITARRILEESLAARAADLVQADRSKDEFLAMLAHELRNPLAPMRNAAEIMHTPGASAEACEEAQGIFARQIENMSRMIDDLLDVSRITEGKIELRKNVVALDAVFTAAASLVRPAIAARGQELAITLPGEQIFLNADATRLDQVFGNLLANACKYSDSGCHISLSAERAPIRGKEPPEVIVRVRDDGIGIAPEMLPHIFDLFVQATYSLDRARGGLGIGLTLVQRLVTMHGGSVEAHSEGLGHGSEFIVRLPILPVAAKMRSPPSAINLRDAPHRILIVDDNEDSARSMAMLQRLRGHDTRTAFTGPEAVTAAAEFEPEVVLLDIGLPGMDGFDVARHLRTMPALTGAFIVAVTGYDSDEDRSHARAAGFDEYLVKPVDTKLLRVWLRDRLVLKPSGAATAKPE